MDETEFQGIQKCMKPFSSNDSNVKCEDGGACMKGIGSSKYNMFFILLRFSIMNRRQVKKNQTSFTFMNFLDHNFAKN